MTGYFMTQPLHGKKIFLPTGHPEPPSPPNQPTVEQQECVGSIESQLLTSANTSEEKLSEARSTHLDCDHATEITDSVLLKYCVVMFLASCWGSAESVISVE
jgi:hypothetical protein